MERAVIVQERKAVSKGGSSTPPLPYPSIRQARCNSGKASWKGQHEREKPGTMPGTCDAKGLLSRSHEGTEDLISVEGA